MAYFYIFLQSNLLELPVYFLFLKSNKPRWNFWDKLLFITGVNAITHPVVFFLIMNFNLTYLQNILLAEMFAILGESVILSVSLRSRFLPCFWVSFFANFLSWQLGPMLTFTLTST